MIEFSRVSKVVLVLESVANGECLQMFSLLLEHCIIDLLFLNLNDYYNFTDHSFCNNFWVIYSIAF